MGNELLRSLEKLSKTIVTYVNVDSNEEYTVSSKAFVDAVKKGAYFFIEEFGLKRGDTVSYLFENCPEIIVLNFICFLTGLRVCPLDARRDTTEVAARKLNETNTKILFYRNNKKTEEFVTKLQATASPEFVNIKNFFELAKFFGNRESDSDFSNITPSDTALILYTSGTTGFPKGTMLSFSNIYYGALQVAQWFEIGSTDVFYLVLPLHHINSTVFALATLLRGGSLVIPSRYSRSRFFPHMARYKATMSSIVPTINIDLLEQKESFDKVRSLLRIKRIQIGSAPVSAQHAVSFYEKYGIRLIQGYGSTETSLRITGVPVDLPKREYISVLKKNSVGIPLMFNEVKIIDGEICVRGKNVMQGYLNRGKETEEALAGGYFHTGDVGYKEQIGGKTYYFLKGRKKEIIIKGGVNISPLFIEERLREQFTWMRDVVVVGFPHYRLGEEIGAIFISRNDSHKEDLKKTVKALNSYGVKNLSKYETPVVGIVAREEEIAKTATGKVQHIIVEKDFKEKLVFSSKYIGENAAHLFRIITPDEKILLEQSVGIHNSVFPKGLWLSVDELQHRATNGFVIGAFRKANKILEGVLTGFFSKEDLIRSGKNWDQMTDHGTFQHSVPNGEVAILVSAASASSAGKVKRDKGENLTTHLSIEKLKKYVESEKDYVVRFHRKPKAGFSEGASVYRFILNGNPKDIESCNVIVIFTYPPLSQIGEVLFTSDKIGIGLVEAAIAYAKKQRKEKVSALSRFGELYKHII